MKKIFNIVVLLLFSFAFIACSNEESETIQSNTDQGVLPVPERFAICKEIAVYHSQGLDYIFNQLKNIKESEKLTFSYISTQKEKIALINSILTDYVSQEKVVSGLSQFDGRVKISTTQQQYSMRSGSDPDSTIERSISFFKNVIDQITDETAIEKLFERVIYSKEFELLSESEKDKVLIMFALYDDSSKYWSENLENWNNLLDNIGLRSGGELTKEDKDDILEADAVGALAGGIAGGITGAIIGGVGGSAAGPAGSAGAAIWGYAQGTVSGTIGTSIAASLTVYAFKTNFWGLFN